MNATNIILAFAIVGVSTVFLFIYRQQSKKLKDLEQKIIDASVESITMAE